MSTTKEKLREFYDSLHEMTHAELADELRRPTMLHDWTREAIMAEALARLLELHPRVVAGETGLPAHRPNPAVPGWLVEMMRAHIEATNAFWIPEGMLLEYFRVFEGEPNVENLRAFDNTASLVREFAGRQGWTVEVDERSVPLKIVLRKGKG